MTQHPKTQKKVIFRGKTIERCQPQDDPDVGTARQKCKTRITLMLHEVKVNTPEMKGKKQKFLVEKQKL